jgi:hypothetical protein
VPTHTHTYWRKEINHPATTSCTRSVWAGEGMVSTAHGMHPLVHACGLVPTVRCRQCVALGLLCVSWRLAGAPVGADGGCGHGHGRPGGDHHHHGYPQGVCPFPLHRERREPHVGALWSRAATHTHAHTCTCIHTHTHTHTHTHRSPPPPHTHTRAGIHTYTPLTTNPSCCCLLLHTRVHALAHPNTGGPCPWYSCTPGTFLFVCTRCVDGRSWVGVGHLFGVVHSSAHSALVTVGVYIGGIPRAHFHASACIVCDEDATAELRVKTVKYFKGIQETMVRPHSLLPSPHPPRGGTRTHTHTLAHRQH